MPVTAEPKTKVASTDEPTPLMYRTASNCFSASRKMSVFLSRPVDFYLDKAGNTDFRAVTQMVNDLFRTKYGQVAKYSGGVVPQHLVGKRCPEFSEAQVKHAYENPTPEYLGTQDDD